MFIETACIVSGLVIKNLLQEKRQGRWGRVICDRNLLQAAKYLAKNQFHVLDAFLLTTAEGQLDQFCGFLCSTVFLQGRALNELLYIQIICFPKFSCFQYHIWQTIFSLSLQPIFKTLNPHSKLQVVSLQIQVKIS